MREFQKPPNLILISLSILIKSLPFKLKLYKVKKHHVHNIIKTCLIYTLKLSKKVYAYSSY